MRMRSRGFDGIEAQAAAWILRRDGGMSAGERAEFERWCAADLRHAAAVSEIDAVWAALDCPVRSGQAELLRARLQALDRRRRRRRLAAGTVTVLAAAASLAVYLGLQRPPARESAAIAAQATISVSQPERRTLPDGSVVELKPGAEVSVAFERERRVVILNRGEAHFSVAKNPQRPFIVAAGRVNIRAVGTAFAVQFDRAEVGVVVTEGKVSVTSLSPATPELSEPPHPAKVVGARSDLAPIVEAGQRAVVLLEVPAPVPVVAPVPAQELAELLAWRLPRLDFSETTIGEATAMFNRYSQTQLRIADPTVSGLRVTGVFRSDNVDGFVRALEASLGVRAEYRDHEIRLQRAP